MIKLSAIIITKNEAHNIGACLESVSFADEIIMVDSGSDDNTVALARAAGATVYIANDWQGFGVQKNRALDLAQGEWVFSIDADERVTDTLKNAIKEVIASDSSDNCYAISRLSYYCGRAMKHGGWYPDHIKRLFRRNSARFSNDLVHESLQEATVTKNLRTLEGHLLHYSFNQFSDVLQKIDAYSSLSAQQKRQRGKRSSVFGAVLRAQFTFIRCYIFKLGFLDGSHGLALAISNAEGTYYKYTKLWHLQYQAKDEEQR